MSDLNTLQLTGRLTRDPECKDINGSKVAKFGFATNYFQGKERDEGTTFLDVEVWGGLATVVEKYYKKGSPVVVSGELRQDNWEKDGEKRSKHFCRANYVRIMDSPKKTENKVETKPTVIN